MRGGIWSVCSSQRSGCLFSIARGGGQAERVYRCSEEGDVAGLMAAVADGGGLEFTFGDVKLQCCCCCLPAEGWGAVVVTGGGA